MDHCRLINLHIIFRCSTKRLDPTQPQWISLKKMLRDLNTNTLEKISEAEDEGDVDGVALHVEVALDQRKT